MFAFIKLYEISWLKLGPININIDGSEIEMKIK